MKLRTVLPALLLSLLTAACATAPDEADDVGSAPRVIVACDTALDLQAELETVYLDDSTLDLTPERLRSTHLRADLEPAAQQDPFLDPSSALRAEGLDTDALCACVDDSCVIDWIDESLGCGVCTHVACADGERGGCVPCTSTDETPVTSCVFDGATVSALE